MHNKYLVRGGVIIQNLKINIDRLSKNEKIKTEYLEELGISNDIYEYTEEMMAYRYKSFFINENGEKTKNKIIVANTLKEINDINLILPHAIIYLPETMLLLDLIAIDIEFQNLNEHMKNDVKTDIEIKLWNNGFLKKKEVNSEIELFDSYDIIFENLTERVKNDNYNIKQNLQFNLIKIGAFNENKNYNIIYSLKNLGKFKNYIIFSYIQYLILNHKY